MMVCLSWLRPLIRTVLPPGYSYDLNGELSSVTDATGVEIKRRVDRQRGIEEIADAFSSSFIHTDIFGRVTSEQKRARGGSSARRPMLRASLSLMMPQVARLRFLMLPVV